MAIFLGKKIGIAGIVLSTIILCSISIIIEPIQANKLIHNKARGIWNE